MGWLRSTTRVVMRLPTRGQSALGKVINRAVAAQPRRELRGPHPVRLDLLIVQIAQLNGRDRRILRRDRVHQVKSGEHVGIGGMEVVGVDRDPVGAAHVDELALSATPLIEVPVKYKRVHHWPEPARQARRKRRQPVAREFRLQNREVVLNVEADHRHPGTQRRGEGVRDLSQSVGRARAILDVRTRW